MAPRVVLMKCRGPYELSLWMAIKDIAGEHGECFLSTPDLAALTGLSEQNVAVIIFRTIRQLRKGIENHD